MTIEFNGQQIDIDENEKDNIYFHFTTKDGKKAKLYGRGSIMIDAIELYFKQFIDSETKLPVVVPRD